MGMLAAWSILNKVNSRANRRYSDTVLVVCPNITIRNRLEEHRAARPACTAHVISCRHTSCPPWRRAAYWS